MEMAGTTIRDAIVEHALDLAREVWPEKPPKAEAPPSVVDESHRWHVITAEPLQETLAAAGLVGHRFEAYLPTFMRKQRQNYEKYRSVRRPLFPGYVFARFSTAKDPWQRLYATRGVRGLLMVGDNPAIVSDAHIDRIKGKEAELARDKALYKVKEGDVVEIDDPLWIGQLGKIETLDDLGRITVLLSLFGREVSVKTVVGRVRSA